MQQELTPLTVTQLNRQVRSWLEIEVGDIAVMGEISNLTKPSSGHFYFTLKDVNAQLRCVYFRTHHNLHSKQFKDGQQVIAKGKLSLYEARGDYQLIVHTLSEAGLGELYRQFELLKSKLQAQGLFEQARKRLIPRFPSIIAVVTSASGAALRDILTTLARRFPLAMVKIYASEVQGKEAPLQLINAINKANHDNQADVLILARGGGSIEDLWAFNNEQLAHAIYASAIPIVAGVGHETDFTIADFVADLRAATPTAAAEAVTPNIIDLITNITLLEERLVRAILRAIQQKQFIMTNQLAKLTSPAQLIAKYWQASDYLERQLRQNIVNLIRLKSNKIELLENRLYAKNPLTSLQQSQSKLHYLKQQLVKTMLVKFNNTKHVFLNKLATLHAVSPLATLERGYAIATLNQKILFDSAQAPIGQRIEVRLAKGELCCEVLAKQDIKEETNL